MSIIKLNCDNLVLLINSDIKKAITSLIQKDGYERAGVIMGSIYPESNAIKITHIIESEYIYRDKYNVETDNYKLQERISEIWENDNTITYVGDWHTHPEDIPIPSFTDIGTIKSKFIEGKLSLNLLIDLIIGRKDNYLKSYDGENFKSLKIEYI